MSSRHITSSDIRFVAVSDFSSFDAAVSGIGGGPGDLLLNQNVTISTNTSIPKNVNLKVSGGALITINSGVTLTINGTVEAGAHQIFSYADSTAKADFSNSQQERVIPQWWGAKGDGNTDDHDALEYSFNCGATRVVIPPLVYRFQSKLYVTTSNVTIEGYGAELKAKHPHNNYGTSLFVVGGETQSPYDNNPLVEKVRLYGFKLNGDYLNSAVPTLFPFTLDYGNIHWGLSIRENVYDTHCKDLHITDIHANGWGVLNCQGTRHTCENCLVTNAGQAYGLEKLWLDLQTGISGETSEVAVINCRCYDVNFGFQISGGQAIQVIGGHYKADDGSCMRCGISDLGGSNRFGGGGSVFITDAIFEFTSSARLSPMVAFTALPHNDTFDIYPYGDYFQVSYRLSNCHFLNPTEHITLEVEYPADVSFSNCTFQGGYFNVRCKPDSEVPRNSFTKYTRFNNCTFLGWSRAALSSTVPVQASDCVMASGRWVSGISYATVDLNKGADGSRFYNNIIGWPEYDNFTQGFRTIPTSLGEGVTNVTVKNTLFGPSIEMPYNLLFRDTGRYWNLVDNYQINADGYISRADLNQSRYRVRQWSGSADPGIIFAEPGEIFVNTYDPDTDDTYAWMCTQSGVLHGHLEGDAVSGSTYISNMSSPQNYWFAGDRLQSDTAFNSGWVTVTGVSSTQIGVSTTASATVREEMYDGKYVCVMSGTPGNIPRIFTQLDDAPSSYSGQAGKVIQVNSDETGLEFGAGGSTFDDDVTVTPSGKGVVLTSHNGSQWRLQVNNSGELTTTSL